MTVYGYTRVSTVEQAEDRSSLEDQARRIQGAAMMRGENLARLFSDPGVSGGTPLRLRPGGAELMKVLQRGDVVIAAKMDRIFRNTEDALSTANAMADMGVALVIADMGCDPVTGSGVAKLFFSILASVAEFERNRIAERVNDGKQAKKKAGGFIGGYLPYGMKVEGSRRTGVLVPNPEEQKIIALVMEMHEKGETLGHICYQLTKKGYRSRNGVPFYTMQALRMIRNVKSKGEVRHG